MPETMNENDHSVEETKKEFPSVYFASSLKNHVVAVIGAAFFLLLGCLILKNGNTLAGILCFAATVAFVGDFLDLYSNQEASDEQMIEAARISNCESFISRQPEGYDTYLKLAGANLSAGQKQLLTIARAVLSDPSILILDEATSSVDTRTEKKIQDAMAQLMKNRTSVIIAHRLSTIMDADKIVVI